MRTLAVLTLLPFVIIMVTSFVKLSVVLSIVRSALGTQQIPPTQVITGLAIILTLFRHRRRIDLDDGSEP